MTERKRGRNLAKCCSVRFAKLNESMKLLQVFEVAQVAETNLLIIGSEMWYVYTL